MNRSRLLLLVFIVLAACRPTFNPASYPNVDSLFQVAMREYNAKRWDNAAKAFERLTTELPARDPRVPVAHFYLGKSQEKTGDRLLAAKSFGRISELFPQDTLADDGLFFSALAYQSLWRKPVLDAEYGENALTQYHTLIALFPNSPLVARANQQIAKLDEWFATKDYETGYHYLKRKAYDSAIIYFKDVIRLHPTAPKAREAYLRLHQAYRAINYRDDARDLCDAMRKAYPTDRDVMRECGPATAAASSQ